MEQNKAEQLLAIYGSKIPVSGFLYLREWLKDKDYETCLRLLSPVCENAVFTCVDKVRGESGEVLAEKAELIFKNVYFDNSVDAAYEKALSLLKDDGVLIVAGSFYLASYVRSLFENLR